jgi:malonyl-ACP O-methyltransferase BioC
MSPWKDQINQAFGNASEDYAKNANLQRTTTTELVKRIAKFPISSAPRVLEIGCGTGFLTQALHSIYPGANWTITDISLDMLASCQRTIGNAANMRFQQMDGEFPTVDGGFDLICANMTFQWFEDLPGSIANLVDLLSPGGVLAYTTLCHGSLFEWQEAHRGCGFIPGTPEYPLVKVLKSYWPDTHGEGAVDAAGIEQKYPNSFAFARAIKGIGAETPAVGHHPLNAGSMRRVLRSLDQQDNVTMTYQVAYATYQKYADT